MSRLVPLALLPLLVACGAKDDTGPLEGDATSGEALFTTNCASCHGAAGEGDFGPELVGITSSWSDEELSDIILNGGEDDMPGFNFSSQEVADVIAFLATL